MVGISDFVPDNLKEFDATIPVGLFACACSRLVGVTGGSGPDTPGSG